MTMWWPLGSPPLTAVAPPKAEVGRVAAELLLQRLAGFAAWRVHRVELLPTSRCADLPVIV